MKKWIASAGALLAVMLLTACMQSAQVAQTTPATTATQPTSTAPATEVTVPFEIHMNYPVFPEYSEAVNAMVKQAANSFLENYSSEELAGDLSLDSSYEIKLQTKDLLSIVFYGSAYLRWAPHPHNYIHALNIDLKTGKRVALADKVKLDSTLLQKIDDAAREMTTQEMYDNYQFFCADADALRDWLTPNDAYDYFYFTKDAVGIILMVHHVYGDYFEIELPY